MSLQKILRYLLLAFVFLLPLQTRWIYAPAYINGGFWEYGSRSLYGTQIIFGLAVIVYLIGKIYQRDFWRGFWNCHPRPVTRHGVNSGGDLPQQVADSNFHGNDSALWLALWFGAVIQGALAIGQFLLQKTWANKWLGMAAHLPSDLGASVIEFGDQRWLRAYGSFGSPNALGIFLGIALVIGLAQYLGAKNIRLKACISVGQLIILTGLLFSFSRGAWVAASVGVAAIIVIARRSEATTRQSLGIQTSDGIASAFGLAMTKQLFFSAVLIVSLVAIFHPIFFARFNLNNRLESKSVTERVTQLGEWKQVVSKHWLLGVGYGNYTRELHRLHPSRPVWNYQPVHNIYLLIIAEFGLFAFSLFLIFDLIFLIYIWQNNRLYFPIVITLLTAGLFDHWLFSMWTGVAFFGLVVVLCINSGQVVDGNN